MLLRSGDGRPLVVRARWITSPFLVDGWHLAFPTEGQDQKRSQEHRGQISAFFPPPPPPPKTSPTALPEEGAGRRKGREEGQRTPPDFRFLPSPPDLERKTAFLRLGTFI